MPYGTLGFYRGKGVCHQGSVLTRAFVAPEGFFGASLVHLMATRPPRRAWRIADSAPQAQQTLSIAADAAPTAQQMLSIAALSEARRNLPMPATKVWCHLKQPEEQSAVPG